MEGEGLGDSIYHDRAKTFGTAVLSLQFFWIDFLTGYFEYEESLLAPKWPPNGKEASLTNYHSPTTNHPFH